MMSSSIGLSGYSRVDRDHYPTPSENIAALVVGLKRAGIEPSSNRVLDCCGGAGAVAHGLNPFGFDVRLTDLYPEEYQSAHNLYATTESLDAGNVANLRRALDLTKARAIVTNPPYSVFAHGRIVKACLTLLQAGEIELLALLHLSNHLVTNAGHATTTREPLFAIRIDCCWRTILFDHGDGKRGKQCHSWRIWIRDPNRKASSAYPTIGVTFAEAKAAAAEKAGPLSAEPSRP